MYRILYLVFEGSCYGLSFLILFLICNLELLCTYSYVKFISYLVRDINLRCSYSSKPIFLRIYLRLFLFVARIKNVVYELQSA